MESWSPVIRHQLNGWKLFNHRLFEFAYHILWCNGFDNHCLLNNLQSKDCPLIASEFLLSFLLEILLVLRKTFRTPDAVPSSASNCHCLGFRKSYNQSYIEMVVYH